MRDERRKEERSKEGGKGDGGREGEVLSMQSHVSVVTLYTCT